MAEQITYVGELKGHSGWVTAIATSIEAPDTVLSASRGTCPRLHHNHGHARTHARHYYST